MRRVLHLTNLRRWPVRIILLALGCTAAAALALRLVPPAAVSVAGIEAQGSLSLGSGATVGFGGDHIVERPINAGPLHVSVHFSVSHLAPSTGSLPQLLSEARPALRRAAAAYLLRLGLTDLAAAAVLTAGWLVLSRRRFGWGQAGQTAGVAGLSLVVLAGGMGFTYGTSNLGRLADASCVHGWTDYLLADLDRLTPMAPQTIAAPPAAAADANQGLVPFIQISDAHLNPEAFVLARAVERGIGGAAAVIDTGDTLSYNLRGEECVVLPLIRGFHRYLWVKGNHDAWWFESQLRQLHNVTVLDGQTATVQGITFYGKSDPLVTPGSGLSDTAQARLVRRALPGILGDLAALPQAPDAVLVHDKRMVVGPSPGHGDVTGLVPLVLSGHFHHYHDQVVNGTRLLEAGTAGGGGLSFSSANRLPFSLNVLYFERQPPHRLAAYYVVTLPPGGRLSWSRHQLLAPDTYPVPSARFR